MSGLISYIRVSTAQQGRSGLGLEAQREAIARFAAAEGREVLNTFVEVETGKGADALDRRPQLAAYRMSRDHLLRVRLSALLGSAAHRMTAANESSRSPSPRFGVWLLHDKMVSRWRHSMTGVGAGPVYRSSSP
jgi:Resolvase, N terminal domain